MKSKHWLRQSGCHVNVANWAEVKDLDVYAASPKTAIMVTENQYSKQDE